ncbi:hypothetical protein [Zooshikella sp. RANM57]|uniref:hypothetical protein n=1 Tax=Zooshikella sp. RANM57 TaxID=3425863 RepID=UPI003D6E53F6
MKVYVKNRKLSIKPGSLQSVIDLNIDLIDSWELVIDDLGNPYLYFLYNGLRQGISLPREELDDYKETLIFIEKLLEMEPKVEISAHQKLFKTGAGTILGIELFVLAMIASR